MKKDYKKDGENIISRIHSGIIKSKCGLISMAIIFVVLTLIMLYKGAIPFGDNTLIVGDGTIQYLPFLSEYRDKLLNHESMLFSWNMGMGG